MLSEEEKNMKNDILFQIDMQLYDEFNDKIATMNDHLGDIYSLKDVEEVEKAEKDKEIKLLREAIKKQQAEIEKLKYLVKKATEIIDEYANETEKDTKKLIEYQEKFLQN